MLDISELVQVHSIGYGLRDVKVTLKHDIKLNIAEAQVDGKAGGIQNIPRWVAMILESEKHADIQDSDVIVELKQSIVKENIRGEFELSTLDPHFYIKLASHMKRLSQPDYDKVESMLNSLVRKRQGKIIRLADSSKLTSDLSKKLTIEEQAFYTTIHKNSDDFVKQILGEGNKQ